MSYKQIIEDEYGVGLDFLKHNPRVDNTTLLATIFSDGHYDVGKQYMLFLGLNFESTQRLTIRGTDYNIPIFCLVPHKYLKKIDIYYQTNYMHRYHDIAWASMLDKKKLRIPEFCPNYHQYINQMTPLRQWGYLLYIQGAHKTLNEYIVKNLLTKTYDELFPAEKVDEIKEVKKSQFTDKQRAELADMIKDTKNGKQRSKEK